MNIFIIGSCVTRDAFTHENSKEDIEIVAYHARTTLARFDGGAFDIDLDDIDLNSKFQKIRVFNDIRNILFSDIHQKKLDDIGFFIIDLVDDRFGLIEYKGIYITNSDELRKSKLFNTKDAKKIVPTSQEYSELWEAGLLDILKYIPKEKIIINNVYWSRKTETGESVSSPERIAFCESVVGRLYAIARKYIPEENFVNYPSDIFVADSKHRWGKSPFHYVQPVYNYLVDYLRKRARAVVS